MTLFDLITYDDDTKTLHVKQATEKGYIECCNHGVFDGSYPNSTKRRGRVQDGGEISPALTCGCETSLFVFEIVDNDKQKKDGNNHDKKQDY